MIGLSIWQTMWKINPAFKVNQNEASRPDIGVILNDYQLPYPGILPGQILYPIKMVRDRARLLLTFSQEKRLAYYLLLADKRLATAVMLAGRNDWLSANSLIYKSGGYLQLAIKLFKQMSLSQQKADIWGKTLKQTTEKHLRVLFLLRDWSPNKEVFDQQIRYYQELSKLLTSGI